LAQSLQHEYTTLVLYHKLTQLNENWLMLVLQKKGTTTTAELNHILYNGTKKSQINSL